MTGRPAGSLKVVLSNRIQNPFKAAFEHALALHKVLERGLRLGAVIVGADAESDLLPRDQLAAASYVFVDVGKQLMVSAEPVFLFDHLFYYAQSFPWIAC
jgi:hypothetical protein